MGAHTIEAVRFAGTAKDAVIEQYDYDERMHGMSPYSGTFAAKPRGKVRVIDAEDVKGRPARSVIREIYDGESDLAEKYAEINGRDGPAGAISLKGRKRARQYRKRKGLEGQHGTVWLLFGWARC